MPKTAWIVPSLAVALTLAGCGGGDTSTSAPTPTLTTPAPGPTPSPSPTPSSVQAQSPTVEGVTPLSSSGQPQSTDPTCCSTIAIRDPDAPNAVRASDIVWDGDETLTAPLHEWLPASFRGRGATVFTDTQGRSRSIAYLGWQDSSTPFVYTLLLPELEEVRKSPGSPPALQNLPESVRVVDMTSRSGSEDRRTIGLFGDRTPAGTIPATGVITYVGEATGRYADGRGVVRDFVGDAIIVVDYSKSSGQVSGTVTVAQFSAQSANPFTITFTANLAAGDISSTTFAADADNYRQRGFLLGGLYGPQGEELAGVFNGTYASGVPGSLSVASFIGGFVAGRE